MRNVLLIAGVTVVMIIVLYAEMTRADTKIEGTVVDHYDQITEFTNKMYIKCDDRQIPIYRVPNYNPTGQQILGGVILGGIIGKALTGDDKGALGGAVAGGLASSAKREPYIVGYRTERYCEEVPKSIRRSVQKYSHSTISFTIDGVSYNSEFIKHGL